MKLGDFINKEIIDKLSAEKKSTKKNAPSSPSLSIQTLLRTHNLSYEKFTSEITDLNIDLPSNIYSELPTDIFNKITIHLEESKKAIPLENRISNKEENINIIWDYLDLICDNKICNASGYIDSNHIIEDLAIKILVNNINLD